ncbi:MAG: hypothetical protein NC084_08130 [Bacteroides sp.]|nr:hypothetical protein [Eubacterium sp.]MCM1418609.1 hypothetical protein [Roseburia sp.]MCM1462663.1 hypothetical protein [Bacteroides sp.]
MRTYFHWAPAPTLRRRKNLILCAAVLCAEVCVAAFLILIFNYCTAPDGDVILRMLAVIAAAVLFGLSFCLIAKEAFGRYIRRRSRYTYLDLRLRGMVYSSYAGEYRVGGERIIVRDVYYLPYAALTAVETERRTVVITGELRHYCMNSDNLGYHLRNGDFEFDRPYLNMAGYIKEDRLKIPDVFGSAKRAADAINAAKKRFDALPAPKPYVFREADFIRRKPKSRVLPESFDYSREWKN